MTPAEREAELEAIHRRMWPELLEAFDHRNDGLAAKHTFDVKLRYYALLFHNGSKCRALAPLMQAERRLLNAERRAPCTPSPTAPTTTRPVTPSTP